MGLGLLDQSKAFQLRGGGKTVVQAYERQHARELFLPVPHNRSVRSSDNASEMLAGSVSGGDSRTEAAPPLPRRS